MFEGFQPFDIEVEPAITIHGIRSGSGPALLLLHGFPQTHHIWNKIAPSLTAAYTVIIPDLRGYGQSSKPKGSESHREYAKSTLARDFATLMQRLGFESFYVCAHDRGARVAHKLCIDYPQAVKKAILLDICPTLVMYEKTNLIFAQAYWHWFFLTQPAPFPEQLITGNSKAFAEKCLGIGGQKGLSIFETECVGIYTKMMADPDSVHGMCEDYRAGATIDLEEQRADIAAGRKIHCPIVVLWGKHGLVEKLFNAIEEWKAVHESGEVNGHVADSGHFIPEEAPEEVLQQIREFLV